MKILALEEQIAGVSAEQYQPQLEAEARQVWNLAQSGQLREIYFRKDRSTAVLVMECDSVADANQLLSTLPLVQNGLIRFKVIPLMPYPGFSRLFRTP